MLALCAVLAVGLGSCLVRGDGGGGPTTSPPASALRVCGNDALLGNGPSAAPEGAVTVPAGDNSSVNFSRPGTTFWFAPGVHTLGNGRYSQVITADGARYVGAPGAVIDGRNTNQYAFGRRSRGVTVEYLTIKNFGPSGGNNNEGVVNHESGENWTIQYNTIKENAGAGVMVGSGNVLRHNCLTSNEQYGFNAYSPGGVVGITVDHNEVSFNNTYDWEAKIEGCGCTGGGKFWDVANATVTHNYVHHNMGVGLWADTNNRGFLFEGNHVSDNDDVGIFYETSYNALIRDNLIARNGLVAGPKNPGFPTAGIYLSESGADRRVDGKYSDTLEITGNRLVDNWSGVVLWENADRYCGSPANTSSGDCTRVNPGKVTLKTCKAGKIDQEPYYSDCRWKTQNVSVHDNTFEHTPANIGSKCSVANSCGLNAIAANYGTWPPWSPYKGRVVQRAIVHRQDNVFSDNTYRGSWRFMVLEQGNVEEFADWRASPYRQDTGSTMNEAPAAPSGSPSGPE